MREPNVRPKKQFGKSAKLALMHKVVLPNKWILKPIFWTVTNHSLATKIYTTQNKNQRGVINTCATSCKIVDSNTIEHTDIPLVGCLDQF